MTQLTRLYKRTNTGKIQEWTMNIEGEQFWATVGQVGGKLRDAAPTTAKPKNEGRANATTSVEQATLEAQAKWQKKKDAGYTEFIDNVDNAKSAFFRPMLAKEYEARRGFDKKANEGVGAYTGKDQVVFPAIMQPKLDGMRLEADVDKALSRKGKPLGGSFNVVNRCKKLFEADPKLRIDGELYNHLFKDEFEDLASLIKKTYAKICEDPDRKSMIAGVVQYHVYDAPCVGDLTEADGFVAREKAFWALVERTAPELVKDGILVRVPYVIVNNHKEVAEEFARLLELGYEGGMMRYDLPYESGVKSWNLLKVKPYDDKEFILVDIEEGTGEWAGIAKKVHVRLEDGTTCKAGVRGSKEQAAEKLSNKADYIGKTVTVRFQGRTKYGKLRFGQVTKWAREDYEGDVREGEE